MKKRVAAENAIRQVAFLHNTTIEEVKKEIRLAMLAGLCQSDPAVQAKWKEVSCAGDVPNPEELILYLAEQAAASNKK